MTLPTQHALFEQLEGAYHKLEASLPRRRGNPCGDCNQCCTASGMTRQSLSELELDYIAGKVGAELILAFRAYAQRERDEDGEYLYHVCPYFNEEIRGCGIHSHRPFACRTFGPYRLEGTEFPDRCVFIGTEKVISRKVGFQEIPMAQTLHGLTKSYWPYVEARVVGHTNEANQREQDVHVFGIGGVVLRESTDRALLHLAKGEAELAVGELSEPGPGEHEVFRLYHLAMALSLLHRYQEAQVALMEALSQAPLSWQLHYSLALNAFHLGNEEQAVSALFKVVERNPLHGLAWGFLGYIALGRGRLEQAAELLQRACRLDPLNTAFAARLEEVRLAVERSPERSIFEQDETNGTSKA